MFVIKHKKETERFNPCGIVVMNMNNCHGLGLFALDSGKYAVCAITEKWEYETLKCVTTKEEADAEVNAIMSALKKGKLVYDCNDEKSNT